MKKVIFSLLSIALLAAGTISVIVSCTKETATEMTINPALTDVLKVGDEATATVTIIADGVKSFEYYKVINGVRGDAVDVLSELEKSGKTYTYQFSYVILPFEDMGTLGFEFKMEDNKGEIHRVGVNVKMQVSVKSLIAYYDWKFTESSYMGFNILSDADKAAIHRFNQDGSYQVDLGAAYASDARHYCYWVYKETPSYGDTIAKFRLISRLNAGAIVLDYYTDYRVTAASATGITMYWDVPSYGLKNVKSVLSSQAKGAFQPYGSAAMETSVNSKADMDCSKISNALLTIP